MEVRYKRVEIMRTEASSKDVAARVPVYLIEAKETGYDGSDKICWRLFC
jgi:hypothetical protein